MFKGQINRFLRFPFTQKRFCIKYQISLQLQTWKYQMIRDEKSLIKYLLEIPDLPSYLLYYGIIE